MSDSAIARIEKMIYCIRGQKIMLDTDLAGLYGVETKRLNEQVKRNIDRFPKDFMFQPESTSWPFCGRKFRLQNSQAA